MHTNKINMPVYNKLFEREYYVIDYIMEKCKSWLNLIESVA